MGYGNVIVLTLGTLFGKIGGKGWIMDTDIFGGVENGIAERGFVSFASQRTSRRMIWQNT